MPRFLIVDDHDVVRRGLKQILAEGFPGASFVEASRSEATLDALARERVDLVLLDINIPGRSGIDVLEEIKRLHPRTPVLVVSGYSEQEFAVRCLRLGAAGYLGKDAASDVLCPAVRKVLAGGRYITPTLAEQLAGLVGGDEQVPLHEALSSRELAVFRLIATGRTLREIAAELHLSEKTIASYRGRIVAKLRISTNAELARYALQHKLVE